MKKVKNHMPSEKEILEYFLLKDMLHAQRKEFDLLSKKKNDGHLNPMKIKMINRVLEPLNKLFKNEPSYPFLDLLIEEDLATNSDVVLIISQYETAIKEFKNMHCYGDVFLSERRWMTKEHPPNYYQTHEHDRGYLSD
jgi:hypothetical protein